MRIIQNEKAFTLIEVMIAAVVVAVVVLGFMGATTGIHTQGQAAYQRSIALQDANQVVELLRNTAASGTFPSNVTTAYPDGGTVSGFTTLTNESVMVDYASTTADPLDVTVTVTYLENGRRNMSASIRTYITQRA